MSQSLQNQVESEKSVDFLLIQENVFKEKDGKIYLGGKLIPEDTLKVLREQARYLETSQLWEVMNSTIINESSDLALRQSENFEQVRFAKALHHWGHVFRNIIHQLTKGA